MKDTDRFKIIPQDQAWSDTGCGMQGARCICMTGNRTTLICDIAKVREITGSLRDDKGFRISNPAEIAIIAGNLVLDFMEEHFNTKYEGTLPESPTNYLERRTNYYEGSFHCPRGFFTDKTVGKLLNKTPNSLQNGKNE